MKTNLMSRLAASAMTLCAATVMLVSAHALAGHPAPALGMAVPSSAA